jgi:hypothetical protein
MPELRRSIACTRQLIHVPILHAPSDMGSAAEGLESAYVERFGRRHWDQHIALTEGFWRTIRQEIDRLDMDWSRVFLYQDGLPVCGKEGMIVERAASGGSENYRLLQDLIAKGATLVGTEDPRLLLEEYHRVTAAMAGASQGGRPSPQFAAGRHVELLAERDAYIAARIGGTLRMGRTGILFLGMMHNVESHLPRDIVVTRLVPPLVHRNARDKQTNKR